MSRGLMEDWTEILGNIQDFAGAREGLNNFLLGLIGSFGEHLWSATQDQQLRAAFRRVERTAREYAKAHRRPDAALVEQIRRFGDMLGGDKVATE